MIRKSPLLIWGALACTLIAIGIYIAYQAFVVEPQYEFKYLQGIRENNFQLLEICLSGAEAGYSGTIKQLCPSPDKCSLFSNTIDELKQIEKENKDDCYRQYPQ